MLTGLLAAHSIILLGHFGGMDRAASRDVPFIPVEMAIKKTGRCLSSARAVLWKMKWHQGCLHHFCELLTALCSGGFGVYTLSTYIHSLISSWRCWHRNKAAVGTLHSLYTPVSTSGWPEDVDLIVFCIKNIIFLQPASFLRGWEEWVSNHQLQIIEIASYCK